LAVLERVISKPGSERQDISPAMIIALERAGQIYQNMGRQNEAETAFLRMTKILERQYGLNNPTLVSPLTSLARIYHERGDAANEQRMRDRLQTLERRNQ
jgi:hypothetical protein